MGYPLDSGNRSASGFVGRSPWTAADALVRRPAGWPGGQPRARAPAPQGSAHARYLSQVDTPIAVNFIMREGLGKLFRELNLHPVLVEVGTTERSPEVWDPLAGHSIYVGIGRDASLEQDISAKFYRCHVLDRKSVV